MLVTAIFNTIFRLTYLVGQQPIHWCQCQCHKHSGVEYHLANLLHLDLYVNTCKHVLAAKIALTWKLWICAKVLSVSLWFLSFHPSPCYILLCEYCWPNEQCIMASYMLHTTISMHLPIPQWSPSLTQCNGYLQNSIHTCFMVKKKLQYLNMFAFDSKMNQCFSVFIFASFIQILQRFSFGFQAWNVLLHSCYWSVINGLQYNMKPVRS